jgi:Ca2+-transporting ATPase
LLAISIGSILIGYAPKFLTPRETGPSQVERAAPLPTLQAAPAPPAAATPPKEADSTAVKGAEPTTGREREVSVTTTAAASGEFFKKKLPSGVELTISSSGIEANLLVFLEDKAKPERVTWFDFDRLQFETGKATPQVSSREQLRNIAYILAAYPGVKTMIGGYTDNVGNPGANKRLSKARADSVRRKSPHRDQRHRSRAREKSTNFPRRDPKIAIHLRVYMERVLAFIPRLRGLAPPPK